MPDIRDVQEVAEFCRWLSQKAEAEFPGLHILTAIYTEKTWPECRDTLIERIRDEFSDVSDQSLKEITDYTGSQACTTQPLSGTWSTSKARGDESNRRTIVMKVNLDDCRSGFFDKPVTEAKGAVSHEAGHLLGLQLRGALLGSVHEENYADTFEALFMSWLGYQDYPKNLLYMRVLRPGQQEDLSVSRRYGFPAIYHDAQDLAELYYARRDKEIPFRQFVEEAGAFVEARTKTLDDWFGFADAVGALSGEVRGIEDTLGAALHAEHPHAHIVQEVTGIEPNLDFLPVYEPNPFSSRTAAFKYPRLSPADPQDVVTTPIANKRISPDIEEWPQGFAILHPDGREEGPYIQEFASARSPEPAGDEPHFS